MKRYCDGKGCGCNCCSQQLCIGIRSLQVALFHHSCVRLQCYLPGTCMRHLGPLSVVPSAHSTTLVLATFCVLAVVELRATSPNPRKHIHLCVGSYVGYLLPAMLLMLTATPHCAALLLAHLQTAQYSTQIFSLAVLLSSLFVYNQMGGIDEAALDRCVCVYVVCDSLLVPSSTCVMQHIAKLSFMPFLLALMHCSVQLACQHTPAQVLCGCHLCIVRKHPRQMCLMHVPVV